MRQLQALADFLHHALTRPDDENFSETLVLKGTRHLFSMLAIVEKRGFHRPKIRRIFLCRSPRKNLVTPNQEPIVDNEIDTVFLRDKLCAKTFPRSRRSYERVGLYTPEKEKGMLKNTYHSASQYTPEHSGGKYPAKRRKKADMPAKLNVARSQKTKKTLQ
jgi:hypothetical protein